MRFLDTPNCAKNKGEVDTSALNKFRDYLLKDKFLLGRRDEKIYTTVRFVKIMKYSSRHSVHIVVNLQRAHQLPSSRVIFGLPRAPSTVYRNSCLIYR